MQVERRDAVAIGIGVLVLATGFLVGRAIDLLEPKQVIVGTVLTTIVIWLAVAVSQGIGDTIHIKELDSVVKRLAAIVPAGFDWLLDDVRLAEIEITCVGNDIWIVSPDLSQDTLKGTFMQAVQQNLKRGMHYTYLVPQTDAVMALVPALRQLFQSKPDRLAVKRIPLDDFRAATVTHIAIYNPKMEGNSPPRVFLELPIALRGYWVEVHLDAALGFVGRFKKYVEA